MKRQITELLQKIVPSSEWRSEPKEREAESVETIRLPLAEDADYSFSFHLHPDGEKVISANLPDSDPQIYFWFKPFEAADYGHNQESLDEDFLMVIETLLTRETTILQKSGFIWHSFRLAYRVGDRARILNQHSGLRLSFAAPPIQGKQRTYRAGPLGEDRSSDPDPEIKCRGSEISLFTFAKR